MSKRANTVVLTLGSITKDGFRVSMRNTVDDDPHTRVNNNPETVQNYWELEELQKRLSKIKTMMREIIESDFLLSKGIKVVMLKDTEYPGGEVGS